MGVVVDLGSKLLSSFEESKSLKKREQENTEYRIATVLRDAIKRGVQSEDRLGIVAVLELISLGYSVDYVQVDLEYVEEGNVQMRFRAAISDPRAGKVLAFQQLLLPFK